MAQFRKLESLSDFQRALSNKYGVGAGADYKPWLRVQDVKSNGNSGKIESYKLKRQVHTLSEGESCFFYLAEFCDSVIDIREQFPLLPLNFSIKIADALGLKHPINPKSKDKTPNIITTDFVLTRSDGINTWYEAVSVKPIEDLANKRVSEKLDIERVWWELQGIKFYIFDPTTLNKIQANNIEWATSPLRKHIQIDNNSLLLAAESVELGSMLVTELCNKISKRLGIELEEAYTVLRTLVGQKIVDVTLSNPIENTGLISVVGVNNTIEDLLNAG